MLSSAEYWRTTPEFEGHSLLREWSIHFSGILDPAQNLTHSTDSLHKILARSSVGHKWR